MIVVGPTTYCPTHDRLEGFAIERVLYDTRHDDGVAVRAVLDCGRTKQLVCAAKEVA